MRSMRMPALLIARLARLCASLDERARCTDRPADRHEAAIRRDYASWQRCVDR